MKAFKAKGRFFKPWLAKSWVTFMISAFEYSLYLYGGMWLLHWFKVI